MPDFDFHSWLSALAMHDIGSNLSGRRSVGLVHDIQRAIAGQRHRQSSNLLARFCPGANLLCLGSGEQNQDSRVASCCWDSNLAGNHVVTAWFHPMASPLVFRTRELDSRLLAPISHPDGQEAFGIALNVHAHARPDTRVARL